MKGIIERPQFDLEVFNVGMAIHVSGLKYGTHEGIDNICLVSKVDKLELKVVYVDEHGDYYDSKITIDDVTSKEVAIKFVEVVQND